jgi:carboxymethylenebutenolidase
MKRRDLLLAGSGLATIITVGTSDTIAAMPKSSGQSPRKGQMVKLDAKLSGYYVAPTGTKPAPAVIVIMEAFGLNDNIKGVCDRLAQNGFAALAPDIYHGAVFPYTDQKSAVSKLKTLQDDGVMAEIGKGIQFLTQQKTVKPGGVGVIGFCMGGRYTFLASAVHAQQVKAAVSYYGGGIASAPDPLGRKALLDKVGQIKAPIMLMYGSEDSYILAEEHERIALALSKAKKQYSMNVFAGAGHGFLSDRRDSYNKPAAEEAWAMTISFFNRHLGT